MRNPLYQILYHGHRLSIDIALGACSLQCAVSRALGVEWSPAYCLLLFLGTLLVYWIDHMQDSKNALLVQPGMRHAVFANHRILFYALSVCLFLGSVYISIINLPLIELIAGAFLAILMVAYLLFHRKVKSNVILQKELLISFLYALSVIFAPAIQHANPVNLLLFFVILFLAALQNLFSVARIEYDLDTNSGTQNILRNFGKSRLRFLQAAMLLLQVVSSLLLLFLLPAHDKYLTLAILLFIATVNYILPLIWTEPDENIHYRILGDGIFMAGFLGCI